MSPPVHDLNTSLAEVLTESVDDVRQREASALDNVLKAHGNRCVLFGCGTLGKKSVSLLR